MGLNSWRAAGGVLALGLVLSACMGTIPQARPLLSTAALDRTTIAFAHQGRGSTSPAVVFQSGLGDDHGTWAQVLQQLPSRIEAIAPDRPGYGASPASTELRDACRIAQEQRALLQRSGVKPPYVLVGHSLGGLYQYVYARQYPDEVAGLVLLDPTHPDILKTLQRETPGAAALLQLARATVFTSAMRQEFDAQTACLDALDTRAPLAAPALLMVSTRPSAYAGEGLQATLGTLRQDWLQLTGTGALTPVANAGHYIQRDAPQAVVAAIRSLVEADAAH
ncbi:alpha/beta fold hydrolase [Pseudorhodoferax sp. Leaf267]|uniref:alpha/beta fold hydrolase n=1 Tax=Pseudorhodoferax sp. Leaf267 TaxID=1736316 RepID=UPI00138F027A|nr:alpha/beta hydrolase [Pseudorhodoferax sp. Leaf267]